MSTEDVSRLAGETMESSVERKRLDEKRKILDAGLQRLKGLLKQGQFTHPTKWDPVSSENGENKPDKTKLSSERASTAKSVSSGAFLVTNSKDKAEVTFDRNSELPVAHRIEQWMDKEVQMRPDEEWDLTFPVVKRGKSKKKIDNDVLEDPVYD